MSEKLDVHALKTMAAYQEGSVVSRTLIKKDTGTVTLFAFDQGQGLSTHSAPFDAMVQIVEGSAEIVVSDVTYNVSEGEMLVMPAGEPHGLTARQPFKMLLTMIKS